MTNSEWFETLFGVLAFMSAGWAAHLWFRASKIKIPPFTNDTWEGKGPFSDALAMQSAKNAKAAFMASLAAFFQGLSMASKILWPYLPFLN